MKDGIEHDAMPAQNSEPTYCTFNLPKNVDWQYWVDELPNKMPNGATLADVNAIVTAVSNALRQQGYNIQ